MLTTEKIIKKESFNYEAELRQDEVTDGAERLCLPMEHTFAYTLKGGELLSEFGRSLDHVIHTGIKNAETIADFKPGWQGEIHRQELDLKELEEIKQLSPGDSLVTFLPIPDEVRAGKTTISGYNRSRMRMLVRLARRQPNNQVAITTFSLDQSYYPGLQAAARVIGHDIPEGQSSNEVAANRAHMSPGDMTTDDTVALMRTAYDMCLAQDFGGEWYAGREPITPTNALAFVADPKQADLVDAHIQIVKDIKARFSGSERDAKLEHARYNFAAVLDDRRSKVDVGVHSFESSGNQARAEGRGYEGDCPTSTLAQAHQLGYRSHENSDMKCVTCPFCSKTVDAKVTSKGIQCPACLVEKRKNGEVLNHKKNIKQLAKTAVKKTINKYNNSKEKYIFKNVIQVGGAMLQAFKNGKLIAEGRRAKKLKTNMSQSE